jgi:acyl phosphate:glycerol-3-phosphate acyltransferase
MMFTIYIFIAYILGSIPTAVWLGKSKYGIDVREHGSKNAGATNTFRVLGKPAGTVVLMIDVTKGALAVLLPFIAGYAGWGSDMLIHLQLVCGITAVLGHVFPLFANFKGGKGVATSLGVIIGIHPLAASICLGIFLVVFIISNYVSLGAMVAAFSFPWLVQFLYNNENLYLMIFSIVLSIAVIGTHHKNIKRIANGEENKMNLFKK